MHEAGVVLKKGRYPDGKLFAAEAFLRNMVGLEPKETLKQLRERKAALEEKITAKAAEMKNAKKMFEEARDKYLGSVGRKTLAQWKKLEDALTLSTRKFWNVRNEHDMLQYQLEKLTEQIAKRLGKVSVAP